MPSTAAGIQLWRTHSLNIVLKLGGLHPPPPPLLLPVLSCFPKCLLVPMDISWSCCPSNSSSHSCLPLCSPSLSPSSAPCVILGLRVCGGHCLPPSSCTSCKGGCRQGGKSRFCTASVENVYGISSCEIMSTLSRGRLKAALYQGFLIERGRCCTLWQRATQNLNGSESLRFFSKSKQGYLEL